MARPSLKTVFCRPSGRGPTVQMGGRVFRKHGDHRFKQIVQCRNTRHPFPRTAVPAEQYLLTDGAWRSRAMNRQLDAITSGMRRLIAQTPGGIPGFITARRRPGRQNQDGEFDE